MTSTRCGYCERVFPDPYKASEHVKAEHAKEVSEFLDKMLSINISPRATPTRKVG